MWVLVGIIAVLGVFGIISSGLAAIPVLAYVGGTIYYVTHFGGKLFDTITEVVRGA